MAEPKVWSPAVQEMLVEAAGDLLPYDDQAAIAGISARTYRSWRSRARSGEEPYATHMAEVWEAEAAGKRRALQEIREHGKKNAAWLCWLLERRFPHQFGMSPGLRPELQEEDESTSAEARKKAILQAHAVTRGEG